MMKNNYNYFIKWWLLFCIMIIPTIWLGVYYNIFDLLWSMDQTKLSFFILIIFVITTLKIGQLNYFRRVRDRAVTKKTDSYWFIADSLTSLGLIGTVTGFMLMLGGSFSEIDVTNITTTKQVIQDMALGMSTALVTTLVGLGCSLLLKLQLVMVEK